MAKNRRDDSFPNPAAGFYAVLYPYRKVLTAAAVLVIPVVVIIDVLW